MTIRGKLYAAIALTILGPVATTGYGASPRPRPCWPGSRSATLARLGGWERVPRRLPRQVDRHVLTFFVFLVLGANIPFDELGENLLPALAVLATLLLLARPLTVLTCVLPDRRGAWTRNEVAFLCWTREIGLVPAALVGVLAGLGVPHMDAYASVVALAIILTLVLQALPAAWLARRLGLLDGEAPSPPSPAPGTARMMDSLYQFV